MNEKPNRVYVYYVAVSGNDAWTGALPAADDAGADGPFATLGRARDAIREMRSGAALDGPVTVMIRGGTYYLDEPLVFDPSDSGTHECPVTYAAYPGEQPVISGGFRITGDWKQDADGTASVRVEDAPYFRQLTVNGRREPRSRTPNEGYFETEEALSGTSFRYRDGDMKRYEAMEDAEVVVIHSWNESRLRISDLDEQTRTVSFRDPGARHEIGWTGTRGPNRYYVANTKEGLDAPREWYLDRRSSTLFYRAEDFSALASAEVIAPRLRQLVRFEGDLEGGRFVEYVRFEGITFSDTDWDLPDNGYPDCGDVGDIVDPATICYEAARHCSFRNNVVRNTGTYALEVNGYDNLVEGNEIHDTGSGGIVTRNYHPEHNVFRYNHIHHCGHEYPSGVGINIDDGGGTFVHNLVHDVTHSGIYGRHWKTETQAIERRNQEQELRIEYNEIYDVATTLDDAGGIFIRDSNIIIRNNLIHDVHSGHKRCPGWGIYLGCETRDTLVERNLVYNCLESLHVWYKERNVTVTNNIFVGSEQFQINFGNPEHLSHENIRIVRNILFCTGVRSKLFTVFGKRSLPAVADYNVIFSEIGCVLHEPVITRLDGVDSFDQWLALGLDKHTIIADPGFVDAANHDYTLKPDSPAFRLGFVPLDFSTVGLRGRPTG
jgi:hypothetical protein